jgi:hypothetical protein
MLAGNWKPLSGRDQGSRWPVIRLWLPKVTTLIGLAGHPLPRTVKIARVSCAVIGAGGRAMVLTRRHLEPPRWAYLNSVGGAMGTVSRSFPFQ